MHKKRLDYLLFALAEHRRYLQSVRLVTVGLPWERQVC